MFVFTYFIQENNYSHIILLLSCADDGLTKEIRQVAEDHLRMCARELSQIESHTNLGGWDHMYMVTKIMATLSSIYAHTSADEAGW